MKGTLEYALVVTNQPIKHGQVVWENQIRRIKEIGWVVKYDRFYLSSKLPPTNIRSHVVLMTKRQAQHFIQRCRDTVPYLTYKLVKITRYKKVKK